MLMNDEIIFDRYYCINSAQTKEIMGLHILQPHHISIRLKVFILMLVPGGLQLPIISMCFAWCSVTSINKSHVLTACVHENCYINTQVFMQYCCLMISLALVIFSCLGCLLLTSVRLSLYMRKPTIWNPNHVRRNRPVQS